MNETEVRTLIANQKNQINELKEEVIELGNENDNFKEDNTTLTKQNKDQFKTIEKLAEEAVKNTPKGMEKLKKDNAALSKRVDKLRELLNNSDKKSLDYQKESEDLAKELKIAERSEPIVKGPEYSKVVTTADLKNVRPYRKPLE